jgi:hypothetical protein
LFRLRSGPAWSRASARRTSASCCLNPARGILRSQSPSTGARSLL